jgi:hypothetical protein
MSCRERGASFLDLAKVILQILCHEKVLPLGMFQYNARSRVCIVKEGALTAAPTDSALVVRDLQLKLAPRRMFLRTVLPSGLLPRP